MLFGASNGGTEYNDARNDGITNFSPISTYQCNLCNHHTSQYPDDDGAIYAFLSDNITAAVAMTFRQGGKSIPQFPLMNSAHHKARYCEIAHIYFQSNSHLCQVCSLLKGTNNRPVAVDTAKELYPYE